MYDMGKRNMAGDVHAKTEKGGDSQKGRQSKEDSGPSVTQFVWLRVWPPLAIGRRGLAPQCSPALIVAVIPMDVYGGRSPLHTERKRKEAPVDIMEVMRNYWVCACMCV